MRLRLILVFIIFSVQVKSQCVAHAGRDTILCAEYGLGGFQLGSEPTATGGEAPYTYRWAFRDSFLIWNVTFQVYASDLLDDTTSANPQLIATFSEYNYHYFYLTVTDSIGNQCYDTIRVRTSNWITSLENFPATIHLGDSAIITPFIFGGIEPVSYSWTPNYCLANPHAISTMSSPDTTTWFTLTMIDSAGCQVIDHFLVNVLPTGIFDINSKTEELFLYPNPCFEKIDLSVNSKLEYKTDVRIIDDMGREVKCLTQFPIHMGSNYIPINTRELYAGTYFILMKIGGKQCIRKFIRG